MNAPEPTATHRKADESAQPPSDAAPCCRSRRSVLGTTVLGSAAALGSVMTLAACSGTDEPTAVPSASGTGTEVLALSKLPVGSEAQVQVAKEQVLLYRPDEKTVLAYSAICTHAGCTVATSDQQQFHCPCHDSVFSATDGSVVSGPAPRALERYAAKITGDKVTVYVS